MIPKSFRNFSAERKSSFSIHNVPVYYWLTDWLSVLDSCIHLSLVSSRVTFCKQQCKIAVLRARHSWNWMENTSHSGAFDINAKPKRTHCKYTHSYTYTTPNTDTIGSIGELLLLFGLYGGNGRNACHCVFVECFESARVQKWMFSLLEK